MATNDFKVLEAAGELRIHPETIRVWLREGRFPHAYRLGRRGDWRIPPHDLLAMQLPATSTKNCGADMKEPTQITSSTPRLPRTVGAAADESFQASESEAYMHEHRDREHVLVE